MMVLDVYVCLLNYWGTILLLFTVGGLLYSTPALSKCWMSAVSNWRDQARQSNDAGWAAYWLGGRQASPKRLRVRRPKVERISTGNWQP